MRLGAASRQKLRMGCAPPGLCVNDFALLWDDDGLYAVLHL
jgi:hypothetical protein